MFVREVVKHFLCLQNFFGFHMRKGRPPSGWVNSLVRLNMSDDAYLGYSDMIKLFGVSRPTIEGFCRKANVPAEYYQDETKKIFKKMKISELKRAAREYIEAYDKK